MSKRERERQYQNDVRVHYQYSVRTQDQYGVLTKSAVLWKEFSQSSSLASKYVVVFCTVYVPSGGRGIESRKDAIWVSGGFE